MVSFADEKKRKLGENKKISNEIIMKTLLKLLQTIQS